MKHKNKVVIFILVALVALLGNTGCFKAAKKPVMGNVTGKVYDSNGKALHRAKVSVYGTALLTETDELGRYALNGISPGQAKLTATFEDKSVVRIVEVKRGETIEDFDLTFEVVDKLPPVITGVVVEELTENSVTIKWVTDEDSNSIVDYATGPVGLGTYTMSQSDTNMVLEHSIELTGLLPGQIYHFRCRSVDFMKNEGVSSDYQFTTAKGPGPGAPQEFALTVSPEQEKLLLSWKGNEEEGLRGYYLYRADSATMPFMRVATIPAGETSHLDDGLLVGVKYYYKLAAFDLAMNESPASEVVSGVTPGILMDNRTWTRKDSPYIIMGDVRVRGGAVLTVEPGTVIKFTQNDLVPDVQGGPMTSLIIQGGLYAVGTEQAPIVFTSAEKAPRVGSWDGLRFIGTTSAHNMLRHVTVMFADVGVNCEGSTPSIEDSEFGFCGVGMSLGMTSSMNVRYNLFQDCDIGLISAGSNIRNNLFVDNQLGAALLGADNFQYNTLDCLIGVQVDFGEPVIKNNIIARTKNVKGIYGVSQTTAEAAPTIGFNNIHNYTIPFNEVTTDTSGGNIEEEPMFVGGFPYDYHLREGSVCLTADESGGELGRYNEE